MTTETTDSAETTINSSTAQLLALAQDALRQRHSADAAAYCQRLLAIDELSGTEIDTAYTLYIQALDDILQYDEAMRQAEWWAATTQSKSGSIDALIAKGRILRRKGDIDTAMRFLDDAVAQATTIRYSTAIASANRFRADIMLTRGDADRALALTRQSLRIYEEAQNIVGQIETLILLQIIYSVMGQFYRAIQAGLRGDKLCDLTDNQSARYLIYNNLGESYQCLYATDRALFYHRQAQVLSISPHPDLIRNLGADLVANGQFEEGLGLLYAALVSARESQDHDTTLQALYSLADGLLIADQVSESRVLGQELLDQARSLNAARYITRATLILGHCARREGDPVAAQDYLQESFIAAEKTNDKTMIWQTHAALADILGTSHPARASVHAMLVKDILGGIALSIEDQALRGTFRAAAPVARWLRPGEYEDN
jgi:tetratricopeptide (TPR) repeat protein